MLTGRYWVPWSWALCHERERIKVCLSDTDTVFDERKDIDLKSSFGSFGLGVTVWFNSPPPPPIMGVCSRWGGGGEMTFRELLCVSAIHELMFMWVCRGEKIVDLNAKHLFLITAFSYKIRNRSPCSKENGDLSDITRLGIGPRIGTIHSGRIFLVHEGWKAKMAMSSVAEICTGAL